MHDLDGYLAKRALKVDEAMETGDYMSWPEIHIDLEPWQWIALRMLARSKGVAMEDLVASIAEKRARDVFRSALQ